MLAVGAAVGAGIAIECFVDVRLMAWRAVAIAFAALTILLLILNLRRSGERARRAAERLDNLEQTNAIQRQIPDAAPSRPRSRDDFFTAFAGG